jgi:glutathione peroxidase
MNPVAYFLESLDFLDWWLLAIVLGIVDVFFLRGWLVILAMGAGITGFVLMLFPQIGWPWQLGGFAAITVAGIAIRVMRSAKSTSSVQSAIPIIQEPTMNNFYDFEIKTIDGKTKSLKDFKGKAILVVNVASECGLTPQYAGLEKLQREFGDRGFTVLGLPCNQFGKQEPGTEAQIKEFCSVNYGVSFPLTSKIEVNGNGTHPVYAWLKEATGGGDIQWNFEKFLIGKDGRIVKRYSPKTTPEDQQLRTDVQSALETN